MIITVELSLYPLKDDFEEVILRFIKKLRTYPELKVYTTVMSTYIKGDMSLIFDTLKVELKEVYTKLDTASTVIKIINRPLPIEDGYYSFSS